MKMNKLKEIWESQERRSRGEKKILIERIDYLKFLRCHIGYVSATETKIFQLEIGAKTYINPHYLQKFKGIEVQILPTEKEHNLFTIILLEKELSEIFILFVEDLLEKLQEISDSSSALKVIHKRVQFWKRLFAKVSGELLSVEQQRGIFGELTFLKKLLELTEDKWRIINSWMGPHQANQDFAINSSAAEIKTSLAGLPKIYISNEHQLDYNDWRKLFLVVVSLYNSSGGITLNGLIEEIISLLSFDQKSLKLFSTKLTLAGIPEEMISEYQEIGLSLREMYFFEVKEGFPLLIPSTFSNEGIFNVRYEINIHHCKDFSTSELEFFKNFL